MKSVYPATLVQLVLCVIGFVLVDFNAWRWVFVLLFQPTEQAPAGLQFYSVLAGLERGEWWRMLTPSYLHFGWIHILFNGACLWLFGTLLEKNLGALWLTIFCVMTAIVSNWAQYLAGGPQIFGGFSGVIYALAAYYYVHNSLLPHRIIQNSYGVGLQMATGSLVVFLLLGLSGLLEFLGVAKVANAAHIGGVISGVIAALIPAKDDL